MANDWNDPDGSNAFWYSGKVTRRRLVGWGGGVLGATILGPAPWRAAFGPAEPSRIGTKQPLCGGGAVDGKPALGGVQTAAGGINEAAGIDGRTITLLMSDDQSKT